MSTSKSTKNTAAPLVPSLLATVLIGLAPNIALTQGSTPAAASDYRLPPRNILDILDAPAPPSAQLSPNQQWLVITERDIDYTTLAELAEPMLMLAGTRFKQYPDTRIENVGITRLTLRSIEGVTERTLLPPDEGRIGSVTWVRNSSTGGELAYTVIQNGAMAVHLYDATTGVDRRLATPGLTGKVAALSFTRDGRQLAFTAATRDAVTLWLADTRLATAQPVAGVSLNHVNGGFNWTRGWPPLVARAIVADRGAPPVPSDVPTGPIVQESSGRAAQGRTFQDLLKTLHDEALFDYYFKNQIVRVDKQGAVTRLGEPGLHETVSPSPDGEYLLASTVERPYLPGADGPVPNPHRGLDARRESRAPHPRRPAPRESPERP